jgi:eukaryotic-like serine/threonine-protein kinase
MVPRRIGRYVIANEFARGGMATVHLGRLVADRGFSRLVAVKMLAQDRTRSSVHAQALEDEARIASRIRHPNVVQPLDVLVEAEDLFVVMEYVHGVSLAELLAAAREQAARDGSKHEHVLPAQVTVAIVLDVLQGLHAAHDARGEDGRPLGIVHRDVSPQNVLVGADGVARLADFGVAKVMRSEQRTLTGAVKGKPSYMPPEQLRGLPLTRQADLYAVGIVLAEALTGERPRAPDEERGRGRDEVLGRIHDKRLADVVRTALREEARERFATAAEMSAALAEIVAPARADEVADRVTALAGDELDVRAALVRQVEALKIEPASSIPLRGATPALGGSSTSEPPPAQPAEIARAALSGESARPRPPKQGSPQRVNLALFLSGCAVALLAATLVLRGRNAGEVERAPPPPVVSAAAPAASPAPVEPPPIATTHAAAASASSVGTPPPPPTRASTRPSKARAATPPLDCDPPFWIDAQGKKHYRSECVP